MVNFQYTVHLNNNMHFKSDQLNIASSVTNSLAVVAYLC